MRPFKSEKKEGNGHFNVVKGKKEKNRKTHKKAGKEKEKEKEKRAHTHTNKLHYEWDFFFQSLTLIAR